MVKLRGPLLCQSCHSQQGHPELRLRPVGPARRRLADDRARARQLHELPFASARIEPSLGFVADTVTAMEQRSHKLSIAVAAVLLAALSGARAEETPAPDTSAWACSKCTFAKGYTSDAELGAGWLDDSSAKFGDYTGLDEDGVYVVANAEGSAVLESGYHIDYELLDLGLDSRSVAIERRQAGQLRVRPVLRPRPAHDLRYRRDDLRRRRQRRPDAAGGLGTRRQHRRHDGARHQPAQRRRRLRPRPLRRQRPLPARRRAGRFGLDYKRDERSGTRPRYGSFGSVTSEMLRPDRRHHRPRQRSTCVTRASSGSRRSATSRRSTTPRRPRSSSRTRSTRSSRAATRAAWRSSRTTSTTSWRCRSAGTACREHRGHVLGRDGAGHAGDGFQSVHDQPDHRRGRAAVRQPRRRRERHACRPDGQRRARSIGCACAARRRTTSATTTAGRATFTSIVHTDLFPVGDDRTNPLYGYERTRLDGSRRFRRLRRPGGRRRRRVAQDRPHRHAARGVERGSPGRLGPRAVPSERLPRLRGQGRRRGARPGPVRRERRGRATARTR